MADRSHGYTADSFFKATQSAKALHSSQLIMSFFNPNQLINTFVNTMVQSSISCDLKYDTLAMLVNMN